MSVRRRLVTGAYWTIGARILVNLVALFSTFCLAGLLTPDDFGLVAIAATLLEIISAATNLSLGNALVRQSDLTDDHFHTSWTLSIARSSTVGAILAALAWPAALIYGDDRLIDVMLVFAASLAITGFANPKLIVFTRDLVFSQDFFLQVSQKIMAFAVSLTLALIYHSYWALVFGVLASQVTYVAVSYVLKPHVPRLGLRHWRELFTFSYWMTLQDLIYTIGWGLDHLLIGTLMGRTALGHFAVASNLAVTPLREAGLSICNLMFPGLARVVGDRERVKAAYVSAQRLLVAIMLPAGFGIALCAEPAVMAFLGKTWFPAVPAIQGLAIIMALQSFGLLAKPLAMAHGAARRLFYHNLAAFLIAMPLSIAGLVVAGLEGLVIGRIVGGLFAIACNLILVRRLIGLPISNQIHSSWRTPAGVAVMTAGVSSFQHVFEGASGPLILGGTLVVGGVLYAGTHYTLWRCTGRDDGPERELLNLFGKG